MMKLKMHHAESLLSCTRDANETNKRVESALHLLDTDMPTRSVFCTKDKSPDAKILYDALNASDLLDTATDRMSNTLKRRGLSVSEEHREVQRSQSSIFNRIFRILWEVTLNESDSINFKKLIKSFASLMVWEDEPCTVRGLYYEQVTNEHTGTIAFLHCHGVTFVNYEHGMFKERAWTVLHNTVQSAVIKARKDFNLGKKMFSAYA